MKIFGPFFRSNKISYKNLAKALPDINEEKEHYFKKNVV